MEMKKCKSCNIELPIENFYTQTIKKTGKTYIKANCKQCENLHNRTKYNTNPKKTRKKQLDRINNRINLGTCKYCDNIPVSTLKVCDYHCVYQLIGTSIGIYNKNITTVLLDKLKSNPYCPYTGELLELGKNVELDHILPRKRFPEQIQNINNLEWVSAKANYAKQDMTKEEFIIFCKSVAAYYY